MKLNLIELGARYTFHAAHRLYNPQWDEKKNESVFGHCARLHGHQYFLEVYLQGPIDEETGMLINGYAMESWVKETVILPLDHRHLNEDVPFFKDHQPTAEWIAIWIHQELSRTLPSECIKLRVRLYETPELWVDYPSTNAA
jgi:6-pyruvoyltetrahydropterin/6-carboxytetrahydropterin synthase